MKSLREIYVNPRRFTIRLDNSQLIPSPRLKGAHLGPVLPHGFSYEYWAYKVRIDACPATTLLTLKDDSDYD